MFLRKKKTFFDWKTSNKIRLWINFFTTRQILNPKLYKASSFETKFFSDVQNSWEKLLSKIQFLRSVQTTKTRQKWHFRGLLESNKLREIIWESRSSFKSNYLKSFSFWIHFFKTSQNWKQLIKFGIKISKACQIPNQPF